MKDTAMVGVAHTNRSFRGCQKYEPPPYPWLGVLILGFGFALLFILIRCTNVLIFRRLGRVQREGE
jgi:hypothetical protein